MTVHTKKLTKKKEKRRSTQTRRDILMPQTKDKLRHQVLHECLFNLFQCDSTLRPAVNNHFLDPVKFFLALASKTECFVCYFLFDIEQSGGLLYLLRRWLFSFASRLLFCWDAGLCWMQGLVPLVALARSRT
jgi:hypothetical protein